MKILVVDDDMLIRKVVAQYFSKREFLVMTSDNGEDALELFYNAEEKFDAIITDIMMPKMNGIEFTKKVKALNTNIPVIAMTAGDIEKIADQAYLFESIFSKPVELAKLLELVLQKIEEGRKGKGKDEG
ncbi:response regulator [Mongoliibacter ruber]|uniref:Response regulator receiver domain-containing protein n=1 Tax=Mongoliibacter ruber TaxID=1750599 RepID=A0A2T0WPF9_9BACT|nr:response regulator [Mongoliibacter ruber]PRY88570.1 response regulator receiver domain-containing protein [Mongoliibacter ruber]